MNPSACLFNESENVYCLTRLNPVDMVSHRRGGRIMVNPFELVFGIGVDDGKKRYLSVSRAD